jgi:hypothetical protein
MGQSASRQNHLNESVAKLTREVVKYSNGEFWEEFLKDCSEQNLVFDLLRFSAIQELIVSHPENVASLVYYTVNKIQFLLHENAKTPLKTNELELLAGCVKILTKIIPPIFAHPNKRLSDALFWTDGYLDSGSLSLYTSLDDAG